MSAPRKKPNPLTPAEIKAIRVRLRMTQEEAADRIGVARRTWMYWENDKRNPSKAHAKLIRLLEAGKL